MTDLAQYIQATPLIDTHEHLRKEAEYLDSGPDILQDLFDNYISADLVVAGATPAAVQRLLDRADPDLRARFAGVREAWERCRHTGYGEAVRMIARRVYDMDEITPDRIEAAAPRAAAARTAGERLRILKEAGNLEHVQIDDFVWSCLPDPSGPEFFLYDLSWVQFCRGDVDAPAIYAEVGIEVDDLDSLREAMAAIFLFVFGGDTAWPNAAVAYAAQARQWLTRALQAEVDDRMLSEREAIALATRFMRTNQEQCFDLEGTRAAIRAAQ